MKLVLAGAWQWPWYEQACATSLTRLGHQVVRFSWAETFLAKPAEGRRPPQATAAATQFRFATGPLVERLNRQLAECVAAERPDVLFLYRAPVVQAETLRRIRRLHPGIVIAQYCNDDPFSRAANPVFWRHLRRGIPLCDIHYVFRTANIPEFEAAGAPRAALLRAYFVPEMHHPVPPAERDPRQRRDVVFAGHYEHDRRIASLARLRSGGVPVSILGGGWDRATREEREALGGPPPGPPAVGDAYREVVCGASICLCFLSTKNRDTYTTRTFEVPAMQGFMLSQYTADIAGLFTEDEEVVLFRDDGELLDKARYYLAHEDERLEIARRGRERAIRDGHDVTSRMRAVAADLEALLP